MNRLSSYTVIAFAALAAGIASAEPTSGPPIQVYGGQDAGRGRMLNDLELTAITKVELAYQPQASALQSARDALARASWAVAPNPQDLKQKADAVGAAELALATSRANAYQQIRAQMKDPTPAKLAAVTHELVGEASAVSARPAAQPAAVPAPAR